MTAAIHTVDPYAALAARPYQKRPLRFIERRNVGDWRLKVYGIAVASELPRAALVEATLAKAAQVLPQPAIGDDRYGIGFVIAHDARTAAIGLIYFWAGQNELHQRCFATARETPRDLKPLEFPAAGCVWELGIIDFERRAWIEDVLANPAGPDLERYFGRQLSADV